MLFPAEGEGNGTGSVEPSWTLPWATPWRVVIVGETLAPIVESDLVTHLNPPSVVKDTGWIKPGRASWSWLSDHDSPQDHDKLRTFIDLAAEMGWEYSLIDANWNIMKNGTIHDLIAHANLKGVGLLLWYNSGAHSMSPSSRGRGPAGSGGTSSGGCGLGHQGVKVDFFRATSGHHPVVPRHPEGCGGFPDHGQLPRLHSSSWLEPDLSASDDDGGGSGRRML